ncbi:MAG TPA: NAD-dependent epimerase/dehydratase family protein [Candidatus Limnocylindrales bacterium]|nr:NAD-dependent epimerase/dehydratase family protein [Candidatus Limnocylindrales bacterium]
MERAEGLQVVLGASGGTGGAIVRELARQGRRVRAVARRDLAGLPDGVEGLRADVTTPAGAAAAIAGASVVYHAAQPEYHQWAGNFERLNDVIARAAGEARARLVFADNLYMYGPGASPMYEDTPQRATDRKGLLRIALAADLLARHERGEVEVTMGRSSDYFGPGGVNTGLGDRVFAAALAGKPASWLGNLETPHSTSYLPDLARALVVLGDRDDAAGRAWHLPVMDALTGREYIGRLGVVLGRPVKARADAVLMVRIAGLFSPTIREVATVAYQWAEPFVSDWSAFEAAFGPFERTPLDEALATTLDWWRTEGSDAGHAAAA